MDTVSLGILVVVGVGVLLFGSSKIPSVARAYGKLGAYMRLGRLEGELEVSKAEAELKKQIEELKPH